jgi:pyrimidine-nucleoside phosphorylase
VRAARSGFVRDLKAFAVGQASMLLGAGRRTAEDTVDPAAGIILQRTVGDAVTTGEPLAELHFNPPSAAAVPEATAMFHGAVTIGDEPPLPRPLIIERR